MHFSFSSHDWHRYDKIFLIKHRCACCGLDRMENVSEIVEHYALCWDAPFC